MTDAVTRHDASLAQLARSRRLGELMAKVGPVPTEWLAEINERPREGCAAVASIRCERYVDALAAWRRALLWTPGLDAALPACLAVCLSTVQQGDQQLFLQMVGEAGTAKTRICDGLLTSKHCFALEHLTGFHSGWKEPGDGEDYSLIARVNNKTLITPEGDVLMSSPRFVEIMSQQRRIFDGTSGATYKNRKEDLRYEGLRTPWIIAGTPALMNVDQSRLGDRFIRVYMDVPGPDEQWEILRQVGYAAMRSVLVKSNGDPSSIMEDNMRRAYQLTGGYVDFLRENSSRLLASVKIDEDAVVNRCATFGQFTAMMRARPDPLADKVDRYGAKEMPTRLTHQFVRMAVCLAAVRNRPTIDLRSRSLALVKKVALDTSRGTSLDVARVLREFGPAGVTLGQLARRMRWGEDRMASYLRFLDHHRIVETIKKHLGPHNTQERWVLTGRAAKLCAKVLED